MPAAMQSRCNGVWCIMALNDVVNAHDDARTMPVMSSLDGTDGPMLTTHT